MQDRMFFCGAWQDGSRRSAVLDKYRGDAIAEVALASADQVDAAIQALSDGHAEQILAPPERAALLARAADLVDVRRHELLELMLGESGFTRSDLDREVDRAIQTLRLCGEEATRLSGEMVPLEGAPGVSGRLGFTLRRPVGIVCAITPFNSPLNTVVHKVGPAIAAGNAVVLKPSLYTPLTAAMLVEILLEAGMPPSLIALLHGAGDEVGTRLVEDERIGFYTFTGSTAVGRQIQQRVGVRPTQMELGGLSSTIVCGDADLERAVTLCVNAAFRKAGQVCTSAQRIYVDDAVVDEFVERFVSETTDLAVGDPRSADTMVGPMISQDNAERVVAWVDEAIAAGARRLAGGSRDASVVAPTVLVDAPPAARVMCAEVFGPVVNVCPYRDLDDVMRAVNDTPYGLAAGIFTNDIRVGMRAAETLRMGNVHINQTSSSRVDLMPYGGVKESGFGREGPRYAAREMTEERLITITYT